MQFLQDWRLIYGNRNRYHRQEKLIGALCEARTSSNVRTNCDYILANLWRLKCIPWDDTCCGIMSDKTWRLAIIRCHNQRHHQIIWAAVKRWKWKRCLNTHSIPKKLISLVRHRAPLSDSNCIDRVVASNNDLEYKFNLSNSIRHAISFNFAY